MLSPIKIVAYLIPILLVSQTVIPAAITPSNDLSVLPNQEQNTAVSSAGSTWYNLVAFGTAILAVGAGISAVLSIFMPLLAYKLCYLFGACVTPIDYDAYRSILDSVNSATVRQERSLEYVEPILTTLIKAYEEYANEDVKKKFKIRTP